MNRQGHENVEFFLGPEVEHTPAHGKRTLFVVGYQEPEVALKQANDNKVQHVYLGANHSFDPELVTKGNAGKAWNELVTSLLDRGFFVTLDYQAHMHNLVLPMLSAGVWQSRLFIPMLAVRIAKIQTSHPNLTVKFDDIDFSATNEGVWCLNHREITDSNRFTPWQDYTSDQILSAIETTDARAVVPERKVINVDTGNLAKEQAAKLVNSVKNEFEKELLKDPDVLEGFLAYSTPVINDSAAGLDVNSASALKPEEPTAKTDADFKKFIEDQKVGLNTSPADAAAAYAEGAKEDPLGKEASTKGKIKK
jgi:hypothetical protein